MTVTLEGKHNASQPVKRTRSQNRPVERKTPAKELGVCHGPKVARGMLDQFALGANIADAFHFGSGAGIRDSNAGDGCNEGSQSWDERKNSHGLCFGRKECGFERVEGRKKRKESTRKDICHKSSRPYNESAATRNGCRSAIDVPIFTASVGVTATRSPDPKNFARHKSHEHCFFSAPYGFDE